MCDAKSLMAFYFPPSLLGWNSDKKDNKKANAQINAANQAAQAQVENNKIANSVQSTEKQPQQQQNNIAQKLQTKKLPLNTSNTGATVGSQTSVGLNLGGY